jgi:N-acetylmuramoyl-L-alanine amidase
MGDWLSTMALAARRGRVWAGFFALALSLGRAEAAAPTEVRAVSLSASASATQVSLQVSRRTSYRLFRLDNPRRIVLDLHDARLVRALRLPAPGGVVRQIRAGDRSPNFVRIVVELEAAVPTQVHWEPIAGGTARQLVLQMGIAAAAAPLPVAPTLASRPVQAAHAPAQSGRDVVVAVDAGHGGQDPGAIGRSGTHEKDVVLAIARSLASRINAEPGMHAVLTRDHDEFLELRERIHRARAAKADLFVSVHADSIRNSDVSGASVYVLSERGATDEAARWLAERENAADLIGGVSLGDKDSTLRSVLLDLSQSANISASMTAAQRVLGALEQIGEVRKHQVQQAGFVVLKSPDIPSMLIETAYISNPTEERRLRSQSQQGRLADAIFDGLRGYFMLNPPPGSRFAQQRSVHDAHVAAAVTSAPLGAIH